MVTNCLNLKGPPGDDGDGAPGTTNWSGITDKPSTFTPATHTHAASDVVRHSTLRVPVAAKGLAHGTLAERASRRSAGSMVADGTLVDADINVPPRSITKLSTGRVTGSNNSTATTLTLLARTAAQLRRDRRRNQHGVRGGRPIGLAAWAATNRRHLHGADGGRGVSRRGPGVARRHQLHRLELEQQHHRRLPSSGGFLLFYAINGAFSTPSLPPVDEHHNGGLGVRPRRLPDPPRPRRSVGHLVRYASASWFWGR